MGMFHRHSRGGKRLQRKTRSERHAGVRLAVLLLCLSMLTGFLPALARATDGEPLFSSVVAFDSITLHYADSYGKPVEPAIQTGQDTKTLLEKDKQLVLKYTYHITDEQCKDIAAETSYYLDVSPHLALPNNLSTPLSLKLEDETTEQQFGTLHANGSKAWVTFDAKENSTDTVLSDFAPMIGAYFYLNCNRAADVPDDEAPIEGHSNLYAMKFENNTQLNFGYAENEPVTATAQINKDGILKDKTITWTIDYTPWQNPAEGDGVTLDTPFELRDTIDASLHSYVEGSVKIDGRTVPDYTSRDTIPPDAETYVLVEDSEDGASTLLTFGGTKFNAGEATGADPAKTLAITYKTEIKDELLLPGGAGGKTVTNAADLFARENGAFNSLNISSSKTVTIPQPTWLTKEGHTTRNPGSGSTTDWTVTFQPNGFDFETENNLTLHDQLPQGSEPVSGSLSVNGRPTQVTVGDDNSFTVSQIVTNGNDDVKITYQTHVPEEWYNEYDDLGSNVAYFTFEYGGASYTTPKAVKQIGSGDGSGTSGTPKLTKAGGKYDSAARTIKWTVNINPHLNYLVGGTFTDDLGAVIPACGDSGHGHGLELVNAADDIEVKISDGLNGSREPTEAEKKLISLEYAQQILTIRVGEIGAKKVTLTYETRVCDPCVFANNTEKKTFTNRISTKDMIIGQDSTVKREVSAEGKVDVGATVLTKKAPVYNYETGLMTWTVEVDAAGLSMDDVVLTDELPAGLTYVNDSFKTDPAIADAEASAECQTLTIKLGTVAKKTNVTFETAVDPEILGFGGDQPVVVVENTIHMNGKADGVEFAEVSHRVQQNFSNHGLVKEGAVDNQQELIRYEVLINPYRLALPENPSLVDTLDKRLQLDTDTLKFYQADVTETTGANGQEIPKYEKVGDGQKLAITDFNPANNSFTVQLPVGAGSREAYVLTYTADIIDHQAGGYSNSVRFDGGSVLLGGNKTNSSDVGGGGGGGGAGVAARKAAISIVKTDSETPHAPLSGVSFLLYQWDSESDTRGLPFAQGTTDAQGKLSFKVKPGGVYELVETESVPGYGSKFGWETLPDGVEETDSGLLITAGAARSELKLELTNEAHTTDIVFRLVNESGIPMAGEKVKIFTSDPTGETDPSPADEATVSPDGTVKFPGIRRGAKYYIQRPDGGIMFIDVPAQENEEPTVTLPDGTTAVLNANYWETGTMDEDRQWELTVKKVISGSDTPLAGAAIGLYADAACRTLIAEGTSGQDGTITFSGLIKDQRYWLKETAAPSNYNLDATVHEASEGNAVVTISNTPKTTPPVNPDKPVDPGTPEEPGAPGEPGTPGKPGTSGKPGTPSEPGTSGKPGTPSEPGTSGEPGASGEPGVPHVPGTPGEAAASNESGTSGEPDASGVPGTSSEIPDSRGASTDDPNIPQTGDHTPLLIAVTLFSGIALAAMTLYRFLEIKKREKK